MMSNGLVNFGIQRYQDTLSVQKEDEAFIINLVKYKSAGILYVEDDNVTYFDRFGVECIPEETTKIHKKQKYCNKYL